MRLDRFVCKSTELTKTDAVRLINAGDVKVNDQVVLEERTQVHENNCITLDGQTLKPRAFRYLLMHKPAGTICANVDDVYPSLFKYVDVERADELHIAGRLDADTTGLVLITDDGRWSFHITTPNSQCEKVYRVGLSRPITDDVADRFKHGVKLQGEDQLTLPATLEVINPKEGLLTITQGKFHQVKRMFAAVGNRVVGLHRERIGDVVLDVPESDWRYLTVDEVQSFAR